MTPDQPFSEPWQAQAFAVTVHLHERGAFTWPDWAETLGAEIVARSSGDGHDAYWLAWLAALERIATEKGLAEANALRDLRAAWETAYLTTPHGHPVSLAATQD